MTLSGAFEGSSHKNSKSNNAIETMQSNPAYGLHEVSNHYTLRTTSNEQDTPQSHYTEEQGQNHASIEVIYYDHPFRPNQYSEVAPSATLSQPRKSEYDVPSASNVSKTAVYSTPISTFPVNSNSISEQDTVPAGRALEDNKLPDDNKSSKDLYYSTVELSPSNSSQPLATQGACQDSENKTIYYNKMVSQVPDQSTSGIKTEHIYYNKTVT